MYKNMELDASINSYLRDHKFMNVCVAPGAALVSHILRPHTCLKNINFENMITLSSESLTSVLVVTENEKVSFNSADNMTMYASVSCSQSKIDDIKIDDIQAGVADIDGHALYKNLSKAGNNYGEHFQTIKSIKNTDDAIVATWMDQKSLDSTERLTVLLDSMTHILGAPENTVGSYYLQSIGAVQAGQSLEIPSVVQITIEKLIQSGHETRGSFTAKDVDGNVILIVSDMTIAYDSNTVKMGSVALASTFTIEPLSEVFEFWNEQLGVAVNERYSQYAQVFQPLLLCNDGFDGTAETQVCLLNIEDWSSTGSAKANTSVQSDFSFGDLDTADLGDGRTVAQLNPYETQYLYREIFIDLTYRRHNVSIDDNDTIVDIGANIGLFSLFAYGEAQNVKVFAVEPSPSVLPILRANVQAYAPGTQVIAAGASEARGEAEFTAYKKSSVFSSFSANESDDSQAISTIIRNTLVASGHSDENLIEDAVEQMMNDRLDFETFNCQLLSVSDIIEENEISEIGLLKIDAEKSEEQIIKGIKSEHWKLIKQIIIEVHKQSGSSVNRVLQKLEEEGFVCVEDEEQLLSNSGLVTIYAVRPERLKVNKARKPLSLVDESADMFVRAAASFLENTGSKLDVVLCPPTSRDPALLSSIAEIEDKIIDSLGSLKNSNVQRWNEFSKLYPTKEIFDDVSNLEGHIPYSKEWYVATATSIYRKHMSRTRLPSKVLVLDCDNTLWGGVVGEVGCDGVVFNDGHKYLHNFVKHCHSVGFLICLASKNDYEGVKEVFDKRQSEFGFNFSDVTAHRINWDAKSENIRSIADELNLGLSSIVFLDDSPIECAEVRTNCPEVLTLQFPTDGDSAQSFLEHVWEFDVESSTDVDANRSAMYQVEQEREKSRNSTESMATFIESLQLDIQISPVESEQLERASQMTQRTNQFNISTIRRTEQEIQALINEGWSCEYVKASDRFGDYGITGLVIHKSHEEQLLVDTLLLSCRILGRGIEYQVLEHLGRVAHGGSNKIVKFPYIKTQKNEPALNFLVSIDGHGKDNTTAKNSFEFDSEFLSTYKYKPVEVASDRNTRIKSEITKSNVASAISPSILVEKIANNFRNVVEISKLIDRKVVTDRPEIDQVYVAPKSDTELRIAEVWCELLGFKSVGIEDNFFMLGGTSLKGVELIARLQKALGPGLSIINLFENPSIEHLARIFDICTGKHSDVSGAKPSKSRSQARKNARRKKPVIT